MMGRSDDFSPFDMQLMKDDAEMMIDDGEMMGDDALRTHFDPFLFQTSDDIHLLNVLLEVACQNVQVVFRNALVKAYSQILQMTWLFEAPHPKCTVRFCKPRVFQINW